MHEKNDSTGSPPLPQEVRILLIEDDPDDADLVSGVLAEMDFVVHVTHDRLLALGLRRLETEPADLVLLDLSLPDSWGMETLRRVRRQFPELPVVLMTGARMSEIADQAAQEGAVGCLFKQDLDATQLARVLSTCFRRPA